MFWSMKLIAKVATSIVAGDALRSGRKATRSMTSESATTTATQARIATHGRLAAEAPRACSRRP